MYETVKLHRTVEIDKFGKSMTIPFSLICQQSVLAITKFKKQTNKANTI